MTKLKSILSLELVEADACEGSPQRSQHLYPLLSILRRAVRVKQNSWMRVMQTSLQTVTRKRSSVWSRNCQTPVLTPKRPPSRTARRRSLQQVKRAPKQPNLPLTTVPTIKSARKKRTQLLRLNSLGHRLHRQTQAIMNRMTIFSKTKMVQKMQQQITSQISIKSDT